MDGLRFDTLARSLTAAGYRRRALLGALSGALGILGLAHRENTLAKKKPCPPCKKRKKGKCKAMLPDGTGCTGGACQGGRCVAAALPPPPDVCQGRDVCVQSGAAACGPAGNECYCWVTATGTPFCGGNENAYAADDYDTCARDGRVCVQGGRTWCPGPVVCVLACCPAGTRECDGRCMPCAPGETCCGGQCVDVQTDIRNCGSCGVRCRFNEQCVDGQCRCGPNPEVCGSGQSCCPASASPTRSACECRSVDTDEFLFFSASNPGQCGDRDFGCTNNEGNSLGTPCTGTTNTCNGFPARVCCPNGTTCDNGTCRYV